MATCRIPRSNGRKRDISPRRLDNPVSVTRRSGTSTTRAARGRKILGVTLAELCLGVLVASERSEWAEGMRCLGPGRRTGDVPVDDDVARECRADRRLYDRCDNPSSTCRSIPRTRLRGDRGSAKSAGGASRTRTGGLSDANRTLFQLSYGPKSSNGKRRNRPATLRSTDSPRRFGFPATARCDTGRGVGA
jgi:hypothetical protein